MEPPLICSAEHEQTRNSISKTGKVGVMQANVCFCADVPTLLKQVYRQWLRSCSFLVFALRHSLLEGHARDRLHDAGRRLAPGSFARCNSCLKAVSARRPRRTSEICKKTYSVHVASACSSIRRDDARASVRTDAMGNSTGRCQQEAEVLPLH